MTTLAINGEDFVVDGAIANAGRKLDGIPLDGLLLNSRMINGIFDDLNPKTREQWAYPDTNSWDPDRNTCEFVAAMPQWRTDGLDAFTIGVQGGSPQGYSKHQPWDTGGYAPDGSLRPQHFQRLRRVLDEADRLGFIVILNLFYQGQEMRFVDDRAVRRAVRETAEFVLDGGWENVAVDVSYFRASTPNAVFVTEEVLKVADFVLIHGNGAAYPRRLRELTDEIRNTAGYRPMPIVVNEDDHFDFDQDDNHMKAALRAHVSWGYFDPGSITTWPDPAPTLGDYRNGFQAVPVNWGPSSALKRAFFDALRSAN